MEYLKSDYGYVSELGQFFIPRAMQEESNIKTYGDGQVALVKCDIENEYIILKYSQTVSREEHRQMQTDNDNFSKEFRAVDELGRVVLPREFMDGLQIKPHDTLVSYLIDSDTIKIKTLVVKTERNLKCVMKNLNNTPIYLCGSEGMSKEDSQ